MIKHYFSAEEFAARRERVYDEIGPDAVAFVFGAGPVAGFEFPRQTNDFYYLSGVETAQAYLLIDGRSRKSALFTPQTDPHAASEGAAPGAAELIALSGVDAVFGLDRITEALEGATTVYVPHSPAEGRLACQDTLRHAAKQIAADPWDAAPSREQRVIATLGERVPGAAVKDLSPILNEMRLIKSPAEIAVMRATGALSARAVAEAVKSTRAGVYEYQLGAIADYIYRINGARTEGYRAIIAGGANIWYAHYYKIDCPLKDGDLVLMDYSPDLSNYTNDIGRMWPVNGKYSPAQRELYGFIVEYHRCLLRYIRPGVLPEQILAEAAAEMRPVIARTRFSKEIYEQAALRTLEFRGHLSHPVGMAVHDVGKYFDRPMQPGLVFALDPQMWIPEERLYIRVEDTVAVTETGVEVLTKDVPLDLDEIEGLMKQPGLIQQFPMRVGETVAV